MLENSIKDLRYSYGNIKVSRTRNFRFVRFELRSSSDSARPTTAHNFRCFFIFIQQISIVVRFYVTEYFNIYNFTTEKPWHSLDCTGP